MPFANIYQTLPGRAVRYLSADPYERLSRIRFLKLRFR